MRVNRAGFILGVVSVAWLAGGPAIAAEVQPVFPGKHWQKRTPAELGLDAAGLARFSELAGGRGCVVRHGYMAYTWGDATRAADVASASKPFYSHLMFQAIAEGRLAGPDEKVAKYRPELNSLNANLGHKDRQMTFRHLAYQTACLGYREPPGTAFDYNDRTMSLFWDTLVNVVYEVPWEEADSRLFRPKLADPLEFEDAFTCNGGKSGRPRISPRDFARFGLLYLNRGKWRDRQVFDARYAEMAMSEPLPLSIPRTKGEPAETCPTRSIGGGGNQCDHNGGYSWLWWLNRPARDGRLWFADAPGDMFMALGHGGRRGMAVMPSLGLIVSWNDAAELHVDRSLGNRAFAALAGAAGWKPDDTRPSETATADEPEGELDVPAAPRGQIVIDPKHPQWLKRNGGRHVFTCGPGDPEEFLYLGRRKADGTRDGDQPRRIERLRRHGGNSIYMQIVRSHGGDGPADHNPFVDSDPAKGLDEDVLNQWEQWFRLMDQSGILIYLFFYDDGARIWDTGDRVGPEEKAFLEAVVGRFKHHKNLIWIVAEESEEALSDRRVRAIAQVIRSADDHGHVVGNHHQSGTTFKAWQAGGPLSHFAMQLTAAGPAAHAGAIEAWNKAAGRYQVIYSESTAVGADGDAIRRHAWAVAMGGLMSMHLAMDIARTPSETLQQCRHLQRFFEATDFDTMAPHDELAHGGTRWVLAAPGRDYIAYSDKATDPLGLMDLEAGRYRLTWLDCVTGQTVVQSGAPAAGGASAWPKPTSFGDEVALSIHRELR